MSDKSKGVCLFHVYGTTGSSTGTTLRADQKRAELCPVMFLLLRHQVSDLDGLSSVTKMYVEPELLTSLLNLTFTVGRCLGGFPYC